MPSRKGRLSRSGSPPPCEPAVSILTPERTLIGDEAHDGSARGLEYHDVLHVVDRDGLAGLAGILAVEAQLCLALTCTADNVHILLGDRHPAAVRKVGRVDVRVKTFRADARTADTPYDRHKKLRQLLASNFLLEKNSRQLVIEMELLDDLILWFPRFQCRVDR